MAIHEFLLEEIVNINLHSDNAYLKVREVSGFYILFWGRSIKRTMLEKDMRNIDLIRSLSFPVRVRIDGDYDLNPEKYLKERFHARFSVTEEADVQVITGDQ